MELMYYGLIVFAVAMTAGIFAVFSVKLKANLLNVFLTFSGSYLFSITVVHILPELFEESESVTYSGVFVLVGFFLQHILEFFSNGVEHGHMHKANEKHHHTNSFVYSVVIALTVHSLLEGTVLNNGDVDSIFMGVVIHKAPAAFALTSVLMCHIKKRNLVLLFLLIFSLASPLGILGSYLFVHETLQPVLLGIVAGSFLQISTTIVFENASEHKFNYKKLFVSLSGAVLAIISELLFL